MQNGMFPSRMLATIAVAVVLAAPASASLILSTPDETSGTGLGAVNTVLTLQGNPDSMESGCVGWNGSMDVTGAACGFGDDDTAITQTRTIGELGLTSSFNLRVVFNYNEDVGDTINLDDLVLRIYSPAGAVLFSSEPFSPQIFNEPFSGTGNAGFVFRLDTEQAVEAAPFFANTSNRIGLGAAVSRSEGGLETFYIADASAVTPSSADLRITKTDSPDPVAQGNTLTYTLTVENLGPNNATGVTVVDTLPASVTSPMASASQGTCAISGRVVTCDLGNLGVNDTATVTITVTAPNADRVITNQASVSAAQEDPDTSNNSATEETEVGAGGGNSADLGVVKSDNPEPVPVGQTLTYTLTVSNAGPDAATGVTLTDILPSTVTHQSSAPSQGTCDPPSGRTVICDLGTIAVSGSATVTIEVTPNVAGVINNTASVSGDETDPDTTNNSAQESTQVGAGSTSNADLVLVKTDSPDPVEVGQPLTYTITVDNFGPADATGVTVSDTLPATVVYDSASVSQGMCAETAGVVTCDLGDLASGAMAVVTLTVIPQSSGSLDNAASVSGDGNDPMPANNTDTTTTTVTGGPPQGIPTASEYGLMLLTLLLALAGWRVLRR